MPLKKIGNAPPAPCHHPEHYATLRAPAPGVWEHTCPACDTLEIFHVLPSAAPTDAAEGTGIIGTSYGVLFGHMIGTLCDAFGSSAVENAFTLVMRAVHAITKDPAASAQVEASFERSRDEIQDTLRKVSDKTAS